MNGQATALQKLANVLDPNSGIGVPRWLLHSVTSGAGLTSIQKNMEIQLNRMGWRCGKSENHLARIHICETGESVINLGRLTDGVLIIFVLDAEPVTLVNTYSQIKQLVGQRPELSSWIAVVSNNPSATAVTGIESQPEVGYELGDRWRQPRSMQSCLARKLLVNCQRFLGFCPGYLGALPADPLVGLAASDGQAVAERWPHSSWSQELNRVVRRALEISQASLQSTQEPDELSSCFSLES